MKLEKGLITEQGLPLEEGGEVIITDSNVSKLYPNLIDREKKGHKKKRVIVIPAGEKSKNFSTYRKIINELSKQEDNNQPVKKIIALGGGVVGDIAGFVASTYKRGINLVQIPTTLLAMIDSSIGGKNGVDLGEKKNYLGTFYQSEQILIDPKFLETLPKKEIRIGIAEMVKYSFVFGKPKKERILEVSDLENLNIDRFEDLIQSSYKVKSKVVKKDKRDNGYRHTLNFGHTIGHAIELLSGITHGEAVAIGMVKETQIANEIRKASEKDVEELSYVLNKIGLPTKIPSSPKGNKIKEEDILKMMKKDKKGEFILALSKKNYKIEVGESTIKKVLKN